jgi:GNAT superfamily N-acetyltransferase
MSQDAANLQIRRCRPDEAGAILEIVNAAAEAYRGVIPDDCWHEPYMPAAELAQEIAEGVVFWACERDGAVVGVMGVQPVRDVVLIRHAYVRPACQGAGVGGALLRRLLTLDPGRRILVGTWAAAHWAIAFYERHGFAPVPTARTAETLRAYWTVSERQIEVSVAMEHDAAAGRGSLVDGGEADRPPT